MRLKLLGLVLLAATSLVPRSLAGGASSEASPQLRLLDAICEGRLAPETVAEQVAECVARPGHWHNCEVRLAAVLKAYAGSGVEQERIVRAGLRPRAGVEQQAWVERMIARIDNSALALAETEPAPRESMGQAPLRSPTKMDVGDPRFDTWLDAAVVHALDGQGIDHMKAAVLAAKATNCQELPSQPLETICADLPLSYITLALLRVALAPLRECDGSAPCISRYIDHEPGALEQALRRGESSHDPGLSAQVLLLRQWQSRRPTRWEAWRDIEEILWQGVAF